MTKLASHCYYYYFRYHHHHYYQPQPFRALFIFETFVVLSLVMMLFMLHVSQIFALCVRIPQQSVLPSQNTIRIAK